MTTSRHSTERKVVLIGATITGNRGAESMLRAAVQRIPEFAPGARFTLLSLYPRDDDAENADPNLKIVPCPPVHLAFIVFPLALIAGALQRLRLPHRFPLLTSALRELHSADMVIDLSGISFVDGRGLGILYYNVVVVLIPLLLKTPLMKYSQALGPFNHPLNRWFARRLLPKVTRIAARGRISREHLDELGRALGPVRVCADAAFAMLVEPNAEDTVTALADHPSFRRPLVGISASSVVEELCRQGGIDYPQQLAAFVRHLIDDCGYGVVIFAHSARPGRTKPKNNDLPVCRVTAEYVDRPENCLFVDDVLNAEQLRVLIGRCRFLVASRFHAMISGLATETPTMLLGWSHKYKEVLEVFGLEDFALDYTALSGDALRDLFDRLERDEQKVRELIRRRLPDVIESSLDNARLAAELLEQADRGTSP